MFIRASPVFYTLASGIRWRNERNQFVFVFVNEKGVILGLVITEFRSSVSVGPKSSTLQVAVCSGLIVVFSFPALPTAIRVILMYLDSPA